MADRYDIHFQPVPSNEQTGGKLFTFGFKAAVGVRGPQKLINRWIKTFLTPKGSDPFDLNNGTGFSGLFGGNMLSHQDMIDALTLFIEDCNEQVRAGDRRNFVPDDERLQSATLTNLEDLGDDGYVVYINIRNAAGLTVAIPLPIT